MQREKGGKCFKARALLKSGLTLDYLDCRSSCAAALNRRLRRRTIFPFPPPSPDSRRNIKARGKGGAEGGKRGFGKCPTFAVHAKRRDYRCWQLRSALYVSRFHCQLSDPAVQVRTLFVEEQQDRIDVNIVSRAPAHIIRVEDSYRGP